MKNYLLLILFLSSFQLYGQHNKGKYIYLIRHAEKDLSTKDNPELTEKGRIRAKMIANLLSSKNIKHIFSTNFNRTKQTADPLSKELDIPIDIYDHASKEIVNILRKLPNNCLVVGHSNSTPHLVNSILKKEKFQAMSESEYDRIYVLYLSKDYKDATFVEILLPN